MNVQLKVIGQPVNRVDGPRKVSGQARYAAEFDIPDLAHGVMVLSTIPSGKIASMDVEAARRAPGVLAVVTHENGPRLPYKQFSQRPQVDAQSGEQLQVFQDRTIYFNGQPIGVVIAETLEQATHAASLVRVTYDESPGLTTFDPSRAREPERKKKEGPPRGHRNRGRGQGFRGSHRQDRPILYSTARAPQRDRAACHHRGFGGRSAHALR